jgi:hypothetical protein
MVSVAGQSMACTPSPNPPPDQVIAQSAFRNSVGVVDVEVTEVGGTDWGSWVVLRPLKVWKGHAEASYRLTVQSSCDIAGDDFQVGAQYRLVLQGGPNGYHADMGDNGLLGRNGGAFNAEIDRLVGSARPANFKLCPCQPPPPPPPEGRRRKRP